MKLICPNEVSWKERKLKTKLTQRDCDRDGRQEAAAKARVDPAFTSGVGG